MKYNYKTLFASQHERFIAILGHDYFSSLLIDEDLSDSAVIVSDRRLYQIGKLYELCSPFRPGRFASGKGKKIVSLTDITSVSGRETCRPLPGTALILFGVIAAMLGLLSDVASSTYIMLAIAAAAIGAGIWLITRLRVRFLLIEYAGGTIVMPVKFITDTELNLFQGIIADEKERLRSGAVDVKECPKCRELISLSARLCRYCGEVQEEVPGEE